MRRDGKLWLIAVLVCFCPMAANADDGEGAKLVAECSAADLSQPSLDSCLERVRVLEETDPSPQLQTLEANLEQRVSGRPVAARTADTPPSRMADVAPEPNMAPDDQNGQDPLSPQPVQPDSSAPRSGAVLEDEPPVSDAPDAPADRTDDGASDPPRS